MSESDLDPLLLERYVAGETTPAEQTRVEHWAAVDPSHRVQVERVRAIWVATGGEFPEVDIGAAWGRSKERLGMEPPVQAEQVASSGMGACSTTHSAPPGTRLLRVQRRVGASPHRWPQRVGPGARGQRPGRLIAIAASVVIALSAAVVWHRSLVPDPRFLIPAVREYATSPGQRLSITLVDRTQLTLAPASRVRLAADYGRPAGAREVELEGEAYFAVVHDAAHPFVVQAHGAVARDVGTAFDVRAYPEDAGAQIAVVEGEVVVGSRGELPVRAGDVATVGNGEVAVAHGVDVATLAGWAQGRLAFANAPLRDVLPVLDRWYGVTVRASDPALLAQPVTITLTSELPGEAVAAIGAVMGLRWDAADHTYTLYPKGHV